MTDKPKTLAETGLKVGDLVLYTSVKDSTGGVIFQIVQDTEPVEPASRKRMVTVKKRQWDNRLQSYAIHQVEEEQYGYWDAQGRKIMDAAVEGFVRIRPIFDFFATKKGKHPRGKDSTLIIHYRYIRHSLQPVDLVLLGTKYVELGLVIRDLAKRNGAEE